MKIKILSLVFLTTMSIGFTQSLDDLDDSRKPDVLPSATKQSTNTNFSKLFVIDENDNRVIKKQNKKKDKPIQVSKGNNDAPQKSSMESQGDLGNWTERFQTKVGEVCHAPNRVSLGEYASAKSIYFTNKSIYGVVLNCPLSLETNTTREDFIEAMKKAGII